MIHNEQRSPLASVGFHNYFIGYFSLCTHGQLFKVDRELYRPILLIE